MTWSLQGPLTGLTKVMGLVMSMDRMVGPDMEKGLERLKAEAEADAGAV